MEFNPDRAAEIIKHVRLGRTLKEACANEDELLAVYDWLGDKNAVLNAKPFAAVYAKATDDQRRSWADMSKQIMDTVDLAGDRADTQRLQEANNRSRFYLSLSKETRTQTQVTVGDAVDKDITISIKKYTENESTPEAPK
jgi:hypothetical protein